MKKTELDEFEKQQAGKNLVEKKIFENLLLTCEKELKENSELLFEAENYYPTNGDGEKDENGEYPEIYEFWSVDEWLGKKLEQAGEIIFECLDFVVWGRCTTGQAIYLDRVIQNIAIKYGF